MSWGVIQSRAQGKAQGHMWQLCMKYEALSRVKPPTVVKCTYLSHGGWYFFPEHKSKDAAYQHDDEYEEGDGEVLKHKVQG